MHTDTIHISLRAREVATLAATILAALDAVAWTPGEDPDTRAHRGALTATATAIADATRIPTESLTATLTRLATPQPA